MAVSTLWPHPAAGIALGAVGLLQAYNLRLAARDLAPRAGPRLWVPWLGLALCSGMGPVAPAPVLASAALLAATWGAVTRPGGPQASIVGLLGVAWLIPLGLDAPVMLSGFGPYLAVAAATVLYLDLGWARWQGLRRVSLGRLARHLGPKPGAPRGGVHLAHLDATPQRPGHRVHPRGGDRHRGSGHRGVAPPPPSWGSR